MTYQANPLSPNASEAVFAARTLQSPELQDFLREQGVAGGTWNVRKLAVAAVWLHPDMAVARAEAEEAAAAVITAEQRPNPVFNFGSQFASNHTNPISPWFFAEGLSIPLETAGKRSKRSEQAVLMADAARWRVSSRAWAARSRVRAAMVEMLGGQENTRLLEVEVKLHEEAIHKLTAQMEAGAASAFELTQARLSLNRSRLALHDAGRIAATSEAKLAAAVGVPISALKGISLDFTSLTTLPTANSTASQRLALTQRADLMALLADYVAAESGLRLEIAKQYPDVKLNPGYDYNAGQNRWQLGVNFELPLNGNKGGIAQAKAKRKTAEAKFLAQQTTIQGEINIALAAYASAKAKAETAIALAKDATEAANTTKQSVAAGELSPLELTRRSIESSTAAICLLAARTEALIAAGALEDAMQAALP